MEKRHIQHLRAAVGMLIGKRAAQSPQEEGNATVAALAEIRRAVKIILPGMTVRPE